MNLKLKAFKGKEIATTTNPDVFIKTENQNEIEQDISKLDCKKIWYKLWKNIATEVKSKSGETKEMKIMSRITDEKAIEEFKNLFSSGSLHYRK